MLELYEALVAQSVERQAVNLQVDCSNQSWGEFFFIHKKLILFFEQEKLTQKNISLILYKKIHYYMIFFVKMQKKIN